MRILGISAFYHDSAAALVEDGDVLAAYREWYAREMEEHDAMIRQMAANLARAGVRHGL